MPKIFHTLASIHNILKENKPSKVCIVTSKTLVKNLSWAIKEMKIPASNIIVLPDGEKAKTWKELEILLKEFSKLKLDRKSIVIALGGGTVGDITGFAASIYLRGIRYIQVPTTLLSQVDSAHGGKTGINFLEYKNQIGSSYLPIATIVDPRFLKSLGDEQIVDGLGEILKAGFIKDISILSLLRKHTLATLIASPDLKKIIAKSIRVKEYFIEKDLKDNELRQILNAGHTLGHALELKYKISHGRAVIIGMIQELRCMETLKLADISVRKNLEDLLAKLGIHIDMKMKADWNTIIHDKKVMGDKIAFPIIPRAGKAKLVLIDLKQLKSIC